MDFLTKPIGRFTLGIWIVLLILLTLGVFSIFFAQGLSLISWDTALSWGMQEDSRYSTDIVEKTIGAISQGEAAADVLIQGALTIITLIGILLRRQFGYVAGIGQAIIWIYVTPLILFQRIALYNWGLVPDLSRVQSLSPVMIALGALPGVIMLICLVANRRYFERAK